MAHTWLKLEALGVEASLGLASLPSRGGGRRLDGEVPLGCLPRVGLVTLGFRFVSFQPWLCKMENG